MDREKSSSAAHAPGVNRSFRRPLDPLIYGGVTAVVAEAVCLLPSLRASRIDPLVALRTE